MALTQRSQSRLYFIVNAEEPTTNPTLATIATTANRVDNKGVDSFDIVPATNLRVKLGNDEENTGNTYREKLKGMDFTVTWRMEYRDQSTDLVPAKFNYGLCAGYYVSFVLREHGDGSGKVQSYGHCFIETPQPGDDNQGKIFTVSALGNGGVDVSDQT